MTESMHTLVDEALACVAAECPAAYLAMQSALGGRRIGLRFGRESFDVALASQGRPSDSHETIAIQTTAQVVYDVLAGERDPLDAILADDIVLHGAADDLVTLGEAALFFVKGAVRCTSTQSLLSRLHGISLLERGESHDQ